MRVILHLATLRGFGSELVGRNVLHALSTIGKAHDFLAYVPNSWRIDVARTPNVLFRFARPGGLAKFWLENVSLRIAVRGSPAEKVFSLTDTTLPACPRPQLLMVQQAYLAYPPAQWGFEMGLRFRTKMKLLERYFALGVRTVSAFTVQTEHMRRHLSERWDIPPQRVFVVPSALDAEDTPEKRPLWAPNPEYSPYVCYIAAPAPHKNHAVLADMVAALGPRSRLRCVLTTTPAALPNLTERARALGVLDRFEFRGNLTRQESYELLSHAVATVIPSKFESFGLTYLEAMAIGTPLIVANVESARELCGDAALYADANSGEDFAQHVTSVALSPELASERARLARQRFGQVHREWPHIASEYLRILEEL
jgi:glycosyltransferase involved in cell wall biosynthesis